MSDTVFILIVFGAVALHWIVELLPANKSLWLSELHLDPALVREPAGRRSRRRVQTR